MARLVRPIYSNYRPNGVTWQDWTREDISPFGDSLFKNYNGLSITNQRENNIPVYYIDARANSGQVRLEKWSVSGKKWLNFELTGFIKWMFDGNSDAYVMQIYGRGGHHSSSSTSAVCDGSPYKAGIRVKSTGAYPVMRKEIEHNSYCTTIPSVSDGKVFYSGSLKGRWVGLKQMTWNYMDGSKISVHNELWVLPPQYCNDSSNNLKLAALSSQPWAPLLIVNDRGAWPYPSSMAFNTKCYNIDGNNKNTYRSKNSIITRAGGNYVYLSGLPDGEHNLVAWRFDDIRAKLALFSAREIDVSGGTRFPSSSSKYYGTRKSFI
jgi:hypothetical protein